MQRNNFIGDFMQGYSDKFNHLMAYQIQKEMMAEEYLKRKELETMKNQIKNEILAEISITVTNTVRKELDDLFKNYNI